MSKIEITVNKWNCCDTLGHRTNGILDSLSCIPDSKAQDFGFHKQTFLVFRNPDCLFFTRGEVSMFSEYRSYNEENKQDLCIYELV